MTGFQKGDYIFVHDGKPVYLRLTLGALSEICTRLDTPDFSHLSKRIRRAEKEDIAIIFRALSRPAHADSFNFSALNIAEAMPALATVFETAFSALTKEGAV